MVRASDLDSTALALGRELDELHERFGKPIMLTEFGADTVAGTHRKPDEM